MKNKLLSPVKLRQALSDTVSSLLALLLAFIVSGALVTITGANPLEVFVSLFKGGLGSGMALIGTLNRMAPILLAGLAITAGNSCGVFNMGFDGQFLMGFLVSGFVAYILPLPSVLIIPVTIIAAVLGSMLWAAIPTLLNVKRNVNIIFSCIMLNYIGRFLMNFLIQQFPGYVPTSGGSPNIQETAELPYLIETPYKLSFGVLIAIVGLIALYVILFKMRVGYEMRATGLSRTAAYSAGIAVEKNAIAGMLLSGVFVGICASIELMGTTGRVIEDYAPDYMGLGIAIAMLGKQNPVIIFVAAFLFAAMKNGTTLMQMNTGVSSQFVLVIQGLIIIFIGIGPLFRYIMNKLNERRVKNA